MSTTLSPWRERWGISNGMLRWKASRSFGALAVLAAAACGSKSPHPTDAAATVNTGGNATTVKLNAGPPIDGPVTMTAPPTQVAGSTIAVVWTGPANSADYIDIVPRGSTETSGEITYQYARDGLGRASLRVPTAPGDYDIRYVLDMGTHRTVKAVIALTVTAASASLKAPAEASAAEPLAIEWAGPQGDGDYIDIVPADYALTSGEITYAYANQGSPAKMAAPGAAGDYDIRYVLEGPSGRRVLSTTRLKVVMPVAALKAPPVAGVGGTVEVTWTGPQRAGDYVDLVPRGYATTSGELSYFYTASGATGTLTAPLKSGEYEIRYVMEAPQGRVVLSRTPLVVK